MMRAFPSFNKSIDWILLNYRCISDDLFLEGFDSKLRKEMDCSFIPALGISLTDLRTRERSQTQMASIQMEFQNNQD